MHGRVRRQHGLDLFTEIFYAVGFDDRLEKIVGTVGRNVADVIDLQAERRRVAEKDRFVRDGTTDEPSGESDDGSGTTG